MGEWFQANGATVGTIALVAVFAIVMYFFAIRPQRKQEREANEMRNSLEVGDEITTIGGIIGKVVSIRDETLVLETSHDRTRIRILKTAIRSVDVRVSEEAAALEAQKKDASDEIAKNESKSSISEAELKADNQSENKAEKKKNKKNK